MYDLSYSKYTKFITIRQHVAFFFADCDVVEKAEYGLQINRLELSYGNNMDAAFAPLSSLQSRVPVPSDFYLAVHIPPHSAHNGKVMCLENAQPRRSKSFIQRTGLVYLQLKWWGFRAKKSCRFFTQIYGLLACSTEPHS